MNSDTLKGGIATPESPSPITPTPQTERTPTPVPYPPYQHPYPAAPYHYPPVQPRQPGGAHVAAWIIGGILAVVVLTGLVVALLAALVGGFVFSTIGQNELSATTTQTFVVSGTPSLVISDAAGNVTIQQGGDNQVTVQVTKHAWGISDADAKGVLNNMVVNVSQSGTTITAKTQWSGPARRSVDLIITVPGQAKANVHLGAGNIDARQLTGAIMLDTGAGNVTADTVTFAGTSRLHTGAGNITVDGSIATGAAVDVLVGAGNATLTLPSDTPAHLTASTGVGNLTIIGWQIPVSGIVGHSASGDLGGNPTGTLTIQVGSGNLTLMSR
jgi:Putative adhesin